MSKETNLRCSDCGLCFKYSEEGIRLGAEHVKITGHNKDLVSFSVEALIVKTLNTINDLEKMRNRHVKVNYD